MSSLHSDGLPEKQGITIIELTLSFAELRGCLIAVKQSAIPLM